MKKSNQMRVLPDELEVFEPITNTQEEVWEAWKEEHNLVLTGSAGTGKTFIACYLALRELLSNPETYRRIVVMRSVVPTRSQGFLPGTKEEKEEAYTMPYKAIFSELFGYDGAWNKMITANKVKFESTSFIRGTTFDNTILIVDEMQNMNFHELDSIITRIGMDSKIIFCGDYNQSDFKWDDERQGIIKFLTIIEQMRYFRTFQFGWEDIVRSDLVRDYIMTKEHLGITR